MKSTKSILFVFSIFALTLGNACAQNNKANHNADDSKIALNGYSPVSYIDLNLAQKGAKAYKSEYGGLKYYFKDAKQKAAFDATPTKYLPEFGGWCATGIAVGSKFRTDPNKFWFFDNFGDQ